MPNEQEYTISELASLAGVTPRTIRYYVSIGLLASPGQVGPGTRYGDGHLARLRLIKKLQGEHLPLDEIRIRLEGLDDDEVEQAVESDAMAADPRSALDYIRRLKARNDFDGSAQFAMLAADAGPAAAMVAPSVEPRTEPPPGQRSQWERVVLGQGVELHIRRPLNRKDNKRVERLITLGRELLEEDPS